MDLRLFAATFGTIFLAELGDKTQLACILMAAKTEKPVTVFLATSAALVLVSLLGVALASIICRYVPEDMMRKIAAAAFVGLGVLIWFDKL
jgi:putative Ca2+/H+ antiporter (TMEM165/GDT1 family)